MTAALPLALSLSGFREDDQQIEIEGAPIHAKHLAVKTMHFKHAIASLSCLMPVHLAYAARREPHVDNGNLRRGGQLSDRSLPVKGAKL